MEFGQDIHQLTTHTSTLLPLSPQGPYTIFNGTCIVAIPNESLHLPLLFCFYENMSFNSIKLLIVFISVTSMTVLWGTQHTKHCQYIHICGSVNSTVTGLSPCCQISSSDCNVSEPVTLHDSLSCSFHNKCYCQTQDNLNCTYKYVEILCTVQEN